MLSDKIWITRKARINAERRLDRLHLITQVLMIYYSFFLVIISFLNLRKRVLNQGVEDLIFIASLAVLITSIFLSSQRFKTRAMQMRNCYTRLDKLYLKVKTSESSNGQSEESLDVLSSEYAEVLEGVENHTSFDYLRTRYSYRKNRNTTFGEFKRTDYVHFWYAITWRFFLIMSLFLLPLLLAWKRPLV